MSINVEPEITGYAEQIVKNIFDTQAKVNGFEWASGGLFNKVFKVNTTEGNFILKMECDKIFFATRKEQIENEVLGNEIFQKAGIPCANILAYDFTKNDIGARYVFMEHIRDEIEDSCLWGRLDDFDGITKAEIIQQYKAAVIKLRDMTYSHFGSVSPSGVLGRHETYDGYYHSTLNLLIKDSEALGVFTAEELDIVKKAAEKPLTYSKKYTPTFVHGDIGYHNAIWGSVHGGENKLYIFDFGNAYYGLPYLEEWILKIHGDSVDNVDIIEAMDLDRHLYENNLIGSFERMFWRVTEYFTEDYAYCREWMISSIEAAKNDTSRTHITDFVNKCREVLS